MLSVTLQDIDAAQDRLSRLPAALRTALLAKLGETGVVIPVAGDYDTIAARVQVATAKQAVALAQGKRPIRDHLAAGTEALRAHIQAVDPLRASAIADRMTGPLLDGLGDALAQALEAAP